MKIETMNPPPAVAGAEARMTRQAGDGQAATDASRAAQPSLQNRIAAEQQQLNRSILTASMDATLNVGNNSLGLLYKSAIEHLNDVLAPDFGDNAIQRAYDAGVDVSPEATAGRIVSMSTAFFSAYRELHPDMDLETALDAFTQLIGSGIDRGFAEARDVLDGLGVLGGDIAANIDKTYTLVQQGLKDFADTFPRGDDQG